MVKGLVISREHFRQFEVFFTLIGGAACVEWFDAEQLEFRATEDLDLVSRMTIKAVTILSPREALGVLSRK